VQKQVAVETDSYFSNIQQHNCPKCGIALGTASSVCFSCGFDASTGATLTTKVIDAPTAPRGTKERASRKINFDFGPGVMFLIGFVCLAGLFGLGFVNKGMF